MIDEELDIPETDDDSFEALLADKRHKELLAAFTKLAAAISDSNKDTGVTTAISQLSMNIEQFILKQKGYEAPKVSVETNQDKVVGSVDDMGKKILQGLQDLMAKVSEKRNYDFTFNRDRAGYMETINVRQK